MFDIIKEQGSAAEGSTSKRLRRTERLGKRPHPFVCFRSGQSEEQLDAGTQVTQFFDGNQRVANMLLSDGVLINADEYVGGVDGFIVAHWYGEHSDSLELEVPNS